MTSSSTPKSRVAARALIWASFAAATALSAACGGAYRGGAGPGAASAASGGSGGAAGLGPRGIEAAGLPYAIVDARTGRHVDTAEFWGRVAASKVVCVGEEHTNPHHHWAQLEVVSRLTPAGPYPQLALAMEMFERPFQGVLDDYALNRIDEAALLSRSGWEERWGYDFAFYRPIVARMVKAGGHLVALNPAKELRKRISRQGLESLSAAEREQLPELKLDDPAHRAWFDGVMAEMSGDNPHSPHAATPPAEGSGHGAPAAPHGAMPAMPSADRIYTVQVLWDESMADGAATWVRANAAHRAVVIAGNGHCHDSAVVSRVKRRGIAEVISVRPIVDNGEGNVAAALARPMNDYLFVMTTPKAPASN